MSKYNLLLSAGGEQTPGYKMMDNGLKFVQNVILQK